MDVRAGCMRGRVVGFDVVVEGISMDVCIMDLLQYLWQLVIDISC